MRRLLLAVAAATILATALISNRSSARAESPNLWLGIREVACRTDGVDAYFAIPPLVAGGTAASRFNLPATPTATYVDLSLFDNGFAPGTFLGSAGQGSSADPIMLRWSGLRPSSMHYYRINALVGLKWIEVERGMFETPDCQVVQRLACDPVANAFPSISVTFRVPYPASLSTPGRWRRGSTCLRCRTTSPMEHSSEPDHSL